MSEITLKLCPCCCGMAEILKQGHREYAPTYSVRCKTCGLTTEDYDSEKEAAGRWNTRKPMELIAIRLNEEAIALEDNFGELIDCIPEHIAIEIVKEEGEIE